MTTNNMIPTTTAASDQAAADFNAALAAAGQVTASAGVKAIYEQLSKLVSDSQAWETSQLNPTNEALYLLLQRCYSIYEAAISNKDDAAQLQVAIVDYFNLNNLKLDRNAHTLNNIVKLVFGVDRKRASAYAVALCAALTDKTKASDLPTYIRNKGGIEEVRRAGKSSSTALTIEQKADTAKSWLSADDFGSYRNEALTRNLDGAKVGNKHLLIVTQEADGSFKVNGLISTVGVVQSALAAYYSQHKNQQGTKVAEQVTTNANADLSASIAAAADSVTH